MAIRAQRVVAKFLTGDLRHAGTAHTQPDCVRLGVKPGTTPSDKPPVRIFLGTEAFQFRAERVFIWSIERVRDPARVYEIYLMRDFAGFKRRLWLTGFTNYRFAIPELAGGQGRAIYNDVDQIYLRDPAELFDLDMGSAGVLSINDRDTSVMLIDCQRMIELWNGQTARNYGNRDLEAHMRQANLWGPLDGGWNARDAEYVPGQSMCIHYTTIHSQPWRPTPQDFVYRWNPAGDIWLQLEHEADEAGFHVFDAKQPSPDFHLQANQRLAQSVSHAQRRDFRRLIQDAGAVTAAYYGYGTPTDAMLGAELTISACPEALSQIIQNDIVDVVLANGLAQLPGPDIAWVLDRLFAQARLGISVAINLDNRANRSTPALALWWYQQLVAAGARAPHKHWRLAVRYQSCLRGEQTQYWSGGSLLTDQPRVWALMHYKTGHRSQVQGLVEALDWQVEAREISRDCLQYGLAMARDRLGLPATSWPDGLSPPWPDVVVASGWLPALAARAVSWRSQATTRLILMGRRGSRVGETQDIGVACRHFRLPPNPRQLETVLPPCKITPQLLAEQQSAQQDLFANPQGPHVVCLVGGDNPQYQLDRATAADLATRMQQQVDALGGTLAVLTSRRTSFEAEAALRSRLSGNSRLVTWQECQQGSNPYLDYLAAADILIVTGESESMLAEAVATGRPVYIATLPEGKPDWRRRIADWVVTQAEQDRFNARGSRRPQEGLQYACARLLDHRVFLPRRDMSSLHETLLTQGVARMLGDSLELWQPQPWSEMQQVAQRIRLLLDLPAASA